MIGLLRLGFDEGITAEGIAEALRRHPAVVSDDDIEQLAVVLEQYLGTIPEALATALGMSKDAHCSTAYSL